MTQSPWLEIPANSDFSLSNIPFGVFSLKGSPDSATDPGDLREIQQRQRRRCGTALGDFVIDLSVLTEAGLFDDVFPEARYVFAQPTLNAFLQHTRPVWTAVRNRIISLLDGTQNDLQANPRLRKAAIHPFTMVQMHLPATIGDYTDFYSSRNHAENVGTMFRGRDNALQPNWLHLPVGYHGRSSTVVVSGQNVRRPCGQLQKDPLDESSGSVYGPCKMLDFELELACFVGGPENPMGTSLTPKEAYDRIFGFVLMNDWSARDIQKWEYVPLGPFTAKNFATTISPWIVTTMALEAFSVPNPKISTSASTATNDGDDDHDDASAFVVQEPVPLDYLHDESRLSSYDIHLTVSIQGKSMSEPAKVAECNASDLYWTAVQQLVHHSVTGCTMRPGDLLGSGTISSKSYGGSLLELSWKGTKEVPLGDSTEVRKFLQDGDIVIMEGWTKGKDRVGFGPCSGKILPIDTDPTPTPVAKVERYTKLKLYNYGVSSASWRVRIVLEAKSIPYEIIPINLKDNENHREEFAGQINLMKQVPVLELEDDRGNVVRISQSIAIVEFLEEAFPSKTPLLPVDPIDRATARQICQIVNSGIQPLQNVAYLQDLQDRSEGRLQAKDEAIRRIHKGLIALEGVVHDQQLLHEVEGEGSDSYATFSLGGFSPSLADAVLVPQLFNAQFVYHMDLESEFPTLARILQTCLEHPWFAKTHPTRFA
jgi:fumarylacetoacetase